MATRVYKIKITYPDWLYRFRWSNLKMYADYLIHKPKCACCGKSVPYKHPEVTHHFDKVQSIYTGNRLIVQWSSRKIFCKDCLAQLLLESSVKPSYGDSFNEFDVSDACQLQGCSHPSYKSFNIDVDGNTVGFRFCTSSWNHSKVCIDCVTTALAYGKESSSHWGQYNKKSVPLNEFGLPVVDGKVKFPW